MLVRTGATSAAGNSEMIPIAPMQNQAAMRLPRSKTDPVTSVLPSLCVGCLYSLLARALAQHWGKTPLRQQMRARPIGFDSFRQ